VCDARADDHHRPGERQLPLRPGPQQDEARRARGQIQGALGPGDESPFVVNIPNVVDVARYRVTFRSGSGVVRHVDRRANQTQLAQAVR